ncbi:MAG: hypothetical protein NC816_01120 [Candidatus Omnitrophica bacterium]|nr:hypothetical protein [Candidatus Omnitrophota bacterium]MCM8809678.1 hypothetical protein [Candidatus Omnitrophota bacterium]MCM8810552.1 hypothetical protein [Candidatus Omnitrophota bacterium]MCM8832515.1 hypothetical protein [Candidatus Omnitrophota bacterium]
MKKLIRVCSFFLLLTSCYINKNVSEKNKIYLEKIENLTNQSILNSLINKKLKETILNYPDFVITNLKENSDYILLIKILKYERIPLFFDKKDFDNIVGVKHRIEFNIEVKRKNSIIISKNLAETISSSIYKEFKEEEIFSKLSEQISKKIYFELLNFKKNEKSNSNSERY